MSSNHDGVCLFHHRSFQIGSNHDAVRLFHHRYFRISPLPLPSYDRVEYISNYIQGYGINLIMVVIY